MASHKMMTLTAQSLSNHTNYSFEEIMEIINHYFDLGPQEYKAFTYIAGLAGLCQGVAFPSQNKIAETLSVDRTRANKLVAQLVKKGLLIVVKVEGIRCNFYMIPTIKELMTTITNKVRESIAHIKETIKKVEKKAQKAFKRISNTQERRGNYAQPAKKVIYSDSPNLPDWFEAYKQEQQALYTEAVEKKCSAEELEKQRRELEVLLAAYKPKSL